MTAQEILALVNAGYTKEEIESWNQEPQPTPEPQPNPEPNPEPTPEPQPNPEPNPEPQPNPEIDALKQELTNTQKQLKDLVKQMQANNRNTASVHITPNDELQKKTDEAMAELIRPAIKGKE